MKQRGDAALPGAPPQPATEPTQAADTGQDAASPPVDAAGDGDAAQAAPAPAAATSGARPPPPEKPAVLTTTTLGERGPNLPIGVLVGGQRVTAIHVREWTLGVEKKIGKHRSEAGAMAMTELLPIVLAEALHAIGPHNFDGMESIVERRMIASGLKFADALYAYVWLRYEALEHEPVAFDIKCPNCSTSFVFDADLASMDVRCVPIDTEDLRRRFPLRKPIKLHGKEVSELWIEPQTFGGLDAAFGEEARGDSAARDAAMIASSIVGADAFADLQTPFLVDPDQLDDMSKFDLEGLIRDIEDNTPGPVMALETKCAKPKCGIDLARLLQPDFDSFFARASLRTPRKT